MKNYYKNFERSSKDVAHFAKWHFKNHGSRFWCRIKINYQNFLRGIPSKRTSAIFEIYFARTFPFVDKVVNNKYHFDGKEYKLPQYGFGRTSEFKWIREAKDEVAFGLKWSYETLKDYPDKFLLEIVYILRIIKLWMVENLDDKEIYFSIGAHPVMKFLLVEGQKIRRLLFQNPNPHFFITNFNYFFYF